MDDRRANIDLVFRNGLKDYEVLPPPEVWNNIRPVVRKRKMTMIVLRAAAAVAVLMSLGFLVYRLSTQINTVMPDVTVIAQDSETPALIPSGEKGSGIQPVINVLDNVVAQQYRPPVPGKEDQIKQNYLHSLPNASYPAGPEMFVLSDMSDSKYNLQRSFETKNEEITEFLFQNPADLIVPVNDKNEKSERWTIAALVSPTYYTNYYSGNDEVTSQLMSDEKPVFSYSGGLAFGYRINKRISVQSGLYYSSFGQELSGISAFGGFMPYDYTKGDHNFEVMTTNGTVYTNNPDIFLIDSRSDSRMKTLYTRDYFDPSKANLQFIDNSLRQNFSYLELPVILRYKLIDRTIDFNLVGGLSSNLLLNNAVYAAVDGGKYHVGKTEGMNLLTFSSSLGMGMEYNFSRNLSLSLEPTFRYYINSFNQSPGLKIHPYSFGIFSGISYKF